MEKKMIHPYSLIGGGKNGEVHSSEIVVERHAFLHALPEAKRRYLRVGQYRIYYARIWGGEFRERPNDEAPPTDAKIRLIFLQGLAGTHTNWFPQLEFFAHDSRFDIVAVDCRGVGLSDTPPGRWGTSDMANDINLLIESLQWNQCHLFGFSLGGMVAIEAALHRPDFYKSVTLISTHAGGLLGTIIPPWGVSPFVQTFGSLGTVGALDRGMELLHSAQYLDEDVDEVTEDVARVASEVLGNNDRITNRFVTAYELILQARKYVESGNMPEIRIEGILKQMGAAITHYVAWDRLYFLKVSGISFLVISGIHDNLVNYMNSILLADALNAPLIMKEDSGHAVNLHHRKEINAAMLKHIERAEAKKSVEGRRPLSPRSGYPPSVHPWTVAAALSIPVYILARRLTDSRFRRTALVVALVSLVLRLTYGPVLRKHDTRNSQ